MNNGKYITRKEAAEILGVNPESVSNYVRRGFFKCRKTNGVVYIDRESFEKNHLEIRGIPEKENAIATYKKELKNELDDLRTKIVQVRRSITGTKTLAYTFRNSIKRLIESVHDMDDLGMKEKDIRALDIFWQEGNYFTISDLLDISQKSVVTAIFIRLRKLAAAFNEQVEKNKIVRDLYTKLALQREHISKLEADKQKLISRLCKYENKKVIENLGGNYINPGRYNLLNTELIKLDLSVRCLNCLRSADIVTVHDLVMHSHKDLLNFRNFGKKSLKELEELVDRIHLRFGMKEETLMKWLSEED